MSIDAAVQALVQQAIGAALPQIVAAVQQQLGGQQAAQQFQHPAQQFQQAAQQAAQQADPFGLSGGGNPPLAQQQVTTEMVQTLVLSMVANETAKSRMQAEMHAMGIQNLPDTRPDQLPELYARFQRIQGEMQGGAAPAMNYAPQQQQQAPVNII